MPAQAFDKITSKEVIAFMFQEMEAANRASWVPMLASEFTSTQSSELYAGLGTVPQMREWIGGKQAKGFREQSVRITNKDWESTIELLVKDLRRDKTGFVRAKVGELMERSATHEESLLSTLISGGTSSTTAPCYDGKALFADDHSIGDSGTIDNNIDSDISTLPTVAHGTTTAPSTEEMILSILSGISQIQSFKDDRGEPINQNAQKFVVMTGIGLSVPLRTAIGQTVVTGSQSNPLASQGFTIIPAINPRLTWTTQIAIFRADARFKTFISQLEDGPNFKAKAEGSDYEFDNAAHQYSVEKSGNVGCGRFDQCCLVTLV